MSRAGALLLLLACAGHLASAYPTFFSRENAGCTGHPEKRYRNHAEPVKDPNTRFLVTDARGKPVTAVCPGATYTVTLSFPEKRLALLTASAGTWAKPSDEECPNRVFFDRSGGFASEAKQSMALTVPCVLDKPLALVATSAKGSKSQYQRAQASLPAAAACAPAPACSAAAAAVKPAAARAAAAKPAAAKPAAAAAQPVGTGMPVKTSAQAP